MRHRVKVAIRLDLYMVTTPAPKIRVWKVADWPLFKTILQEMAKLPLLWNENIIPER